MKIAHWNQRFYPLKGGVESHIAAIVNGMKEHQFEIITNLLPSTSKREKYLDNATIIRFPPKDYFRAMTKEVSWKINYSYSATAEMLRTKRQIKYLINSDSEILHVHGVDSSLTMLSANTGFEFLGKISDAMYDFSEIKKPIIMTKHFLYSESLPKQYHSIERRLLNQIDGIICVSKEIERIVSEMVPDKTIWHIPNFVDTDRFKPLNPDKRKHLRESLNLHGKIVGIFVARLTEGKGLEMLLDVWSVIAKDRKNSRLIIVGGGKMHDVLVIKSKELGLENHVTFTGQIKNPEAYLQAADFYIQASESEGLSISLLEAMACGLPVVATDVGGTREVVKDCVNGWLIEPDDNDRLKSCLMKILDKDKRVKMGEAARDIILNEYSLISNVKKIENIYKSFIQ